MWIHFLRLRGRITRGDILDIGPLTGRKTAHTPLPGKTRTLNHFLINRKWMLVDCPGYGDGPGYQSSKQERHGWHELTTVGGRGEGGRGEVEGRFLPRNWMPFTQSATAGRESQTRLRGQWRAYAHCPHTLLPIEPLSSPSPECPPPPAAAGHYRYWLSCSDCSSMQGHPSAPS